MGNCVKEEITGQTYVPSFPIARFFGFPPPLRKQTNTQTLSEGELRKPTKEEGSIRFQCVIVALCHLLSVQSVGRAHLPFQSASQLNHRASFFLSGMGQTIHPHTAIPSVT